MQYLYFLLYRKGEAAEIDPADSAQGSRSPNRARTVFRGDDRWQFASGISAGRKGEDRFERRDVCGVEAVHR